MRLIDRLAHEGRFLFRWRSFVPLVAVPLAIPALVEASALEATLGEAFDDRWRAACLALAFVGLAVRWATVGFVPAGTSGRNTRAQRAASLNTEGLYSVVRHPLYLGNFITYLAVALATETWWFVALFALAFWLYIERVIAAEESFLAARFGEPYARWAAVTPAFVPRLGRWRAPRLRFSVRTVLRREYNGVVAVLVVFALIEALSDVAIEGDTVAGWLSEDAGWAALLPLGLVVLIGLRVLKKHTHALDVAGR